MKKQFMNKAKKKGITPMEILLMKEAANKASERVEMEATEKAYFFMLSIPLNILAFDYWPKSAKKRLPEFLDKVISLYESVQCGSVTYADLQSVLKEYAGLEFDADWLRAQKAKIEKEKENVR